MTARSAGAPTSMIHLLHGRCLELVGGFGLPEGWELIPEAPFKKTLIYQVVHHGVPLVVDDFQTDRRVPADALVRGIGALAYAGFPIRDPDLEIVGVCCVLDYRRHRWLPHELTAVDDAAQTCTAFVAERLARTLADRRGLFLDALLESLRTAVAACDAAGSLVFANSAMRRLLPGAPDEEFLGWLKSQANRRDGDGAELGPETLPLLRALRGEQLRDVEATMTTPDGRPTVVTSDAQPITDTDGNTVGAVVAATDITDRRRGERFHAAELAVAHALAQARDVADAAPAVLEGIAEALGWPHAELWCVDQHAGTLRREAVHAAPGRPVSVAVPSELPCGHGLAGAACRGSDLIWIRDAQTEPGSPLSARTAAEAGIHTAVAVPVLSGGRAVAVLTFLTDAVEERTSLVARLFANLAGHLGQFLERQRAEDLQLALARSTDEYIALVGHEMRTPLTSIAAYTELLLDFGAEQAAPAARPMLEALRRNSDQLKHIVDELLDLAALDTGHAAMVLGPCDLAAIVRDVLDANPELTGGRFVVDADLPRSCVVHADTARMRQVVSALIGNAVAYSPDGGTITVRLRERGSRMAELTVADSGIGIAPNEREQVFQRFHRSSRARDRRIPGAGLALAICRAVVDRHHGSITVRPTTTAGITIEVRLPRHR